MDASTEGMKASGYYDAHSEYQRRVIESGASLTRSMMEAVDLDAVRGTLTLADYGAGTGATSVHAVGTAIGLLRRRARKLPILVVHNDVPTSDFSQLFRNIVGPAGYVETPGGPIYPAAVAGSFFTQVLPSGTVHVGMCSNAAHWLREQPSIRVSGGMFFADAHGPAREELARRAAGDWLAFLEARGAELGEGGHLLVQGIGAASEDGSPRVSASRLLRVMWKVADGLAQEGLLDRSCLEHYVFPVYCRSVAETIAPAGKDGPLGAVFEVAGTEVSEVSNPYWEAYERDGDRDGYAKTYVEFVRAFAESTLLAHLFRPGTLGRDPEALSDEFFERLRTATATNPEEGRYEAWIVRTLFVRR